MNYKEWLNIKSLSESFKYVDEDKVIKLIVSYFKKNLSQSIITYPYREKFYCNIDSNIRSGILFYTKEYKCFRLNWIGTDKNNFEFESVDIWLNGSKDPDYHYNVSGKSIAFILSLVVSILKDNSIKLKSFVANYALVMFDDVRKEDEVLMESRTEMESEELSELVRQAYNILITNKYNSDAIPENLAERIVVLLQKNIEPVEVAKSNDVAVKTQEVSPEAVKPVELVEPEYKAEVLSNIENTKNVIIQEFENMKVDNFVHKVVPSNNILELEKKVSKSFSSSKIGKMLEGDLKVMLDGIVNGNSAALILTGTAGIGKTSTIERILGSVYGLKKERDYTSIGGSITPLGIYQTLYDWKDDKIIIFDDIDSVFQKDSNVLKKALDSYPVRKIDWVSSSSQIFNPSRMTEEEIEKSLKKGKYPNNFQLTSSVIFITNIPLNKLDKAMVDRCQKMDMTFTEDEILERIKEILPLIKVPISIEEKETVLDLILNSGKNGENKIPLSVRSVENAFKLYVTAKKDGSVDWKKFVIKYSTQGI